MPNSSSRGIASNGPTLMHSLGWLVGKSVYWVSWLLYSLSFKLFRKLVSFSPIKLTNLTRPSGITADPLTEPFQPPLIDVSPIEREGLLSPVGEDLGKYAHLFQHDLLGVPDVSALTMTTIVRPGSSSQTPRLHSWQISLRPLFRKPQRKSCYVISTNRRKVAQFRARRLHQKLHTNFPQSIAMGTL